MSPVSELVFFFSSRRRHTRFDCDWSSDVCSSDLLLFSGGVDSTLNSLAFRELVAPAPVSSYNVAMSAPRFPDESGLATQVAQALGLNYVRVDLTEDRLLQVISDVAWHLDEPLADPVAVAQWYVTRLARECGMTVLHAGEGADELFCGYDVTRRFLRHNRWLWEPLARLPRFVGALGYATLRGVQHPRAMKVADVLRRRALGQRFYMAEAIGFYEHEKQRLLTPRFLRDMQAADSFFQVEPVYQELAAGAPGATFIEQITYVELTTRLPELLLMRTDKMGMANSIEIRVPFLDKALVEFALAAPLAWKLRDGVSKEPLKRLATDWTNQDGAKAMYYRPKSGFSAPIQDWFAGALGRELRSRLVAASGSAVGLTRIRAHGSLVAPDGWRRFRAWAAEHPQWRDRLAEQVSGLEAGRFEIFDASAAFSLSALPWDCDWRFDHRWEPRYFRRYQFDEDGKPTPYDVKWPWELSRLGALVPLIQHAALHSGGRSGQLAQGLVTDWERRNPIAWSVNWVPMEASVRGVTLALGAELLAADPSTSPELIEPWLRLAIQHGEVVARPLGWADGN